MPATLRPACRGSNGSTTVRMCTAQAPRSGNKREESRQGWGKRSWSRKTRLVTGSLPTVSKLPMSVLLPRQRDGHSQPWSRWGKKIRIPGRRKGIKVGGCRSPQALKLDTSIENGLSKLAPCMEHLRLLRFEVRVPASTPNGTTDVGASYGQETHAGRGEASALPGRGR